MREVILGRFAVVLQDTMGEVSSFSLGRGNSMVDLSRAKPGRFPEGLFRLPTVSGTFHGVYCLFSEFTTSYKWDSLLDIVQVQSFVPVSLVAHSSNLLSCYFQVVKFFVH